MGQYYLVVNLTKREYLNPRKFGDGAKLLEFGSSAVGTMCGLAILLADGNNRGGGDLRSENPIIGSWAGDKIVIAGDYADAFKFVPRKERKLLFFRCLENQRKRKELDELTQVYYARQTSNLYYLARYFFKDISDKVIEAMKEDANLAGCFAEKEEKLKAWGIWK